MPHECVIVPSPGADWQQASSIVGLARSVSGKLFRKHILNRGGLIHPATSETINIDDGFINTMKQNFTNQICDIVQVPLANDRNDHVENPAANLGEVVGVEDDASTGKVYALVDVRKDAENFGKTYLGASAFFHLDYPDTKTGKRAGPTLLHVAVTNRPYVTGLDPYEAVAAAAEAFTDPAVMELSGRPPEGNVPRSLEDVLAELKTDHDVDVEGLRAELSTAQEKVATAEADTSEGDTALAEQIAATLQGTGAEVKLTGTEVSSADLVSAVAELAQNNVALSNARDEASDRIAALEKRNTATEIDGYIAEGRILPAKREVYLSMALSHRDMFDQVLPTEPLVALGVEQGQSPRGDEHKQREVDVDSEIARLTASLSGS